MAKRKKEIFEVKVEGVDFPNKGYGFREDRKVSFKGGVPGQLVEVKTVRKREQSIQAKLWNTLALSPLETEIPCGHFDVCGGCLYQRLPYVEELAMKDRQLRKLFEASDLRMPFDGVIAAPESKNYRNKMEFTFSDEEKDGRLTLGMHERGKFYSVVNIRDCHLCDQDFNRIVERVHQYFLALGTRPYHKKTHQGFLRHLIVRKAWTTGEIMVNLVTTTSETLDVEAFQRCLLEGLYEGKIRTILHTCNDSLSDAVIAEEVRVLYGDSTIEEHLFDLSFEISPFSFFQTNSQGAQLLYGKVLDYIGDTKGLIVFDLYSGTGTIAQIVGKRAEKVIGIELIEEAVEKARENARLNGLSHVEFLAGDVLTEVPKLNAHPDVIVIDPPRDGIHPKAIQPIIEFGADRFIYVSCNPLSLVRDLKIFEASGYEISRSVSVDMFPRTANCETVVLLSKKEE